MGLTPQVPGWPAAALKDGERGWQPPAAHVPPGRPPHLDSFLFISPVLPWFETKHINTFRRLDCMNLGVLCVYLPLPHAITSPRFLWEKV